MAKNVVFFDTEISVDDKKIKDIGAVRSDKGTLHTTSVSEFCAFVADADFLCGHNVVHHDMKYLAPVVTGRVPKKIIDTLYLSPLLFPKRPYHKLLKDDKLQVEELNNPVNDSQKAQTLFFDEVNAFWQLSIEKKKIFCGLLYNFEEFQGFFDYVEFKPYAYNMTQMIADEYKNRICANANIDILVKHYPRELAYTLALIGCDDSRSTTPPWLLHNFPKIENVIKFLCNTPCADGCEYCKNVLDVKKGLKQIFGFDNFRTYNGEPLQEMAARAAVEGKSLLAVFPTGGGKSITFQLPALMAGKTAHGLTVVISPLQSLMKDQVDNLAEKGIEDAVTVNGMLNPIERADALERVKSGKASLLYISPEQLRSRTIESLLMSRNIVRFVIDEAHCFSAWGQDFRVDYLYIGDFIRKLQKAKQTDKKPIPVSCFTATAKQKVITDICDYFKKKLDLDLEIFASTATRENLHYTVLYKETDEEKYNTLRALISQKDCPTIIYVSRTKRTFSLANKLTSDGFKALPYNGKMESNDKIANQEAFMNNEVSVIVATSAFGMGVDKSDVRLVVHYDISDSLENYVQEAGRAGRDPSLQADCYVLFNDNDLDKHFILLNQTKLSISEIQQVWKAIKDLTRNRPNICCSALEIARQAGWDDSVGSEMETRVRTAISALETAGYIVRGRNVPRVYATSIRAKDMTEASYRIRSSVLFTEEQKTNALRIVKSLISSRSIATAGNSDAESRVDYLADILGIEKEAVIESINLMRQEGLLEDYNDMSAYIYDSDSQHKSTLVLDRFSKLERFILSKITDEGASFGFKELNEDAQKAGITTSSVKNIRTLLHYLTIKNYVTKEENRDSFSVTLVPSLDLKRLMDKFEQRIDICRFILGALYEKVTPNSNADEEQNMHLIDAKTILSAKNGMNIYRGCTHGCIYCDSRSDCYGMDHLFEDIAVKKNAPELLENALRKKRKPCMIGTGSMCDPYMHCEENLGYTRRCLEIIDKYDCGVTVITKSDLILRDIDLFEKINRKSKAVIQMTLTTYDEDLCHIIEPNVCGTKRRFEVLKEFQKRGIPSVVWLCPILPFINDTEENLRGILEYCFAAGVVGIVNFGFGVTLRNGSREYFYQKLDEHFPGMKERYKKRFGNAYECPSDNEKKLWRVFKKECQLHGVLYSPDDIFSYLNAYPTTNNQLSFFD